MENQLYKGLTTAEVEELQIKYGYNELIKTKRTNPLRKFLGIFKEPMFLLLVGAAALYFILGEPREALIMLVFVVFVASITFIQEWKTEQTMNALKDLTAPKVNVLRDGRTITIKSTELVPGDIVFLSEGERIPADCEVLEVSNFSVDESVLTGESEHVFKVPVGTTESSKEYWKQDYLYAGTLSVFGKCTARVAATGLNTEYGKIGKAISEAKEEMTPLQRKTRSLVKAMALTGLVLCLIVVCVSYLYNKDLIQSILSGITLAMGIIPEEFPVVLTVFLSLGAFRLAKQNTLMRRISAVETLGSATVLCVDKTGTITQNNMKVKVVYDSDNMIDADRFKDGSLGRLMVMACEKDPYDPMEKAIVNAANMKSSDAFDGAGIEYKIPFDSKTKRMANIYDMEKGFYVAAKGSPETIIPLCDLENDSREKILDAVDKMSSRGLRVIALADAKSSEVYENLDEYTLSFRGLVGLQDPPKDGVREAIQTCKKAGIRVVMITGDYSKTAMAIGNEIGLKYKDCAITGDDIDSMSEDELCEAVKHCDIFSRVIPEHKMKIVKALKKNGDIVAMTGDGVNDAPALKNADIGVAMGKRGTEVAKEASHMILMDDNFTTIVNSVKDGRRIYDNIRKAMVYILIIHIPIAALALFAPLFNLPQLLLPVHIVLLELIIDPTCSIIFEGEEAEQNIMDRPPRSPKEPLLTGKLLLKVLLQGLTMFLAAFLPFHYLIDMGYGVDYARSFALVTLVFSNVILVLVNRSNTQYFFRIFGKGKNRARLFINCAALVMVLAIVFVPFLQPVFKTAALDIGALITALAAGFIAAGWWEAVKLFENMRLSEKVQNNKSM